MNRTLISLLCGITISLLAGESHGQLFSSDLNDIKRLNGPIVPIGDYGEITKIIDLRGYVPISAVSKIKDNDFPFTMDIYQYYKLPVRSTLRQLYYGPKELRKIRNAGDGRPLPQNYDEVTRYFGEVPILNEENLTGEDLNWARFSYGLTRGETGKRLYKGVCGSYGYENVEPIAVLLTNRSTFVIVNFRWSSTSPRKGTGQTLVAFEFSRSLKEYKEVHVIYDISAFSSSNRELLQSTGPLIVDALRLYMIN